MKLTRKQALQASSFALNTLEHPEASDAKDVDWLIINSDEIRNHLGEMIREIGDDND